MVTPTRPFTRQEVANFLAFADSVLVAPPARPWIERHPGRGLRLFRFALPLEMAPTSNIGIRHRPGWALAKDRASCLATMSGQMCDQLKGEDGSISLPLRWCKNGRGILPFYPEPLSGRPQLRAIRFCSVCPDDTAAFWKQPGDCLLPPRTVMRTKTIGKAKVKVPQHIAGLGILRSDTRSALRTDAWWEPAKPGCGFVLLEVWNGQ